MKKVEVRDVQPILGASVGTIIGIANEDVCWEVLKRESGGGEFMDFVDKTGKMCRLYVRRLGKLPYGVIERRRW